MRLFVLGGGGIGSHLIEELCKSIEQEQIDPNIELFVADNDIVELEQIKYQNFDYREAGLNKAEVLARRFHQFGVTAINDRIKTPKQLKGFDFILLCVDNDVTRQMVIEHCFSKDVNFIDLRATGRRISAFPRLENKESNLTFVDSEDKVCYSCQDRDSLERGNIDKGNKIIALIGVQMFLNSIRGFGNKVVNLTI